ncbi:DUF2986 domain-containing protein [Shewanella maritima]|uniref:DUF2986 domain-containing protein n=1 Tax=Shewanella maritima TaxID=2520507 RepID=UPI0037365D7C
MNRRKKINQTLKAKAKKANSKFHSTNKPKYIAKADREAMEKTEACASVETLEPDPKLPQQD